MEIDELLNVMDRAAANLAKLEEIWERASPFLPSGPAAGSDPEYDDLSRAWGDVLSGLPKIDGWTITDELPDPDAIGRAFIDYMDIGEPPFRLYDEIEKPSKDIAEYRFRLNRARRRATRGRIEGLSIEASQLIDSVIQSCASVPATKRVDTIDTARFNTVVTEIERMLGDSISRQGRWSDLRRHIRFSEAHDWRDIKEQDWPTVWRDIQAALFSETDPLPVPEGIDIGRAAYEDLTGEVATELKWNKLNDNEFERLLFNLLRCFPENSNVQWLTRTPAPDRGRDLSMDRTVSAAAVTRTERVIVQAKHWQSKSVGVSDVSNTLANVRLWEPPLVRCLIIATSGRFTSDAVAWIERHNATGAAPIIEPWPDSTLEMLLAQKPHVAAAHGLR